MHNPHLTPLREGAAGVEVIDMHYPLVHASNQRPYHFLHGYAQFLEERLGVRIPLTRFCGDIHLSPEEKALPPPGFEHGVPERFWMVMAGGKFDFTAKWWNPASYQAVVEAFGEKGQRDRGAKVQREGGEEKQRLSLCPSEPLPLCPSITFVQCGESGHWHPPLSGVVNLVGKTNLREFIRLMYHAEGVLCPVTFAMHLAAAVETKPGRPMSRPCVVVAGGREPPHWEAYPAHQYISTVGILPCCETGGCWKSRCQQVGDGDPKDRRDLCERPVQVSPDLRVPECMEMISPADVVRRIEMYMKHEGKSGGVREDRSGQGRPLTPTLSPEYRGEGANLHVRESRMKKRVLIEFRHGLGDAVQLSVVLRHLAKYRPEWQVDVAALRGKHSAFYGLCNEVFVLDEKAGANQDGSERHGGRSLQNDKSSYDEVYNLDWHESRENSGEYPNTKATRCLREVFGITPDPELCGYEIQVSEDARERARSYLVQVCSGTPRRAFPTEDGTPPRAFPTANGRERFPAVLIHYEGNTSGQRKNLSHDLARELCDTALRLGFAPIILDWDRRSPLPDGMRIHNPGADHELWSGLGTGDAETLAALIDSAALMIGIDSGPLHVAGATMTPTIAVWTQHHPVHFFDLCANVLHLVPGDHAKHAAGPSALAAFDKLYRRHVYKQPYVDLPARMESLLTGARFDEIANKRFLKELTATGYTERYYEEHKLAGLDYLNFGQWHEEYGRWFVESLGLKGRRLLDVGCACGAILRGLGQAGAVVQGVELNEHMVQLGRNKWPDMARLLHVCDAVNLHLFANESWDAIHSAQVAEHWRPELVPFILRELARVVTPSGLFFAALDTEELFARQGRTIETEDPTHVCIRPLAWWHEQLAVAGWQVCTADFEPALRNHPESFLARYDWDWFVARQ